MTTYIHTGRQQQSALPPNLGANATQAATVHHPRLIAPCCSEPASKRPKEAAGYTERKLYDRVQKTPWTDELQTRLVYIRRGICVMMAGR